MESEHTNALWWERPDLGYRNRSLTLGGHDLASMAYSMGTPLFVYSSDRIRQNLQRLHKALENTGLPFSVYYAMKANRFAPLLTFIRQTGLCGIDACSPDEVSLARSCGFQPSSISLTATSLSDDDMDRLIRHPGLIINCDSVSQIRKVGKRSFGREIGIRLNPAMGVGYGSSELLRYSGGKTTKFGIYREQLKEAIETAEAFGLSITRIHFHTGCGYLSDQLDAFHQIIRTCLDMAESFTRLETVNVGGGLGLPHKSTDHVLDLDAWAGVIGECFSGTGLRVEVEPGDFIVKDSGILLLTVNTVETKQNHLFAGLNGGFNLAMEPAFYSLPCETVPCRIEQDPPMAFSPEDLQNITLTGNINEALDIWAESHLLPPLAEGDTIALVNAGGYASSMSSNHCMRGSFSEMLLPPNFK